MRPTQISVLQSNITKLLPLWLGLLFTVILGLASPTPTAAQDPVINFEHITLDDGLSDNTVYSIAQDTTGFLWFGTQNGLNKFDGYHFTVYKHDPFNANPITNNPARFAILPRLN